MHVRRIVSVVFLTPSILLAQRSAPLPAATGLNWRPTPDALRNNCNSDIAAANGAIAAATSRPLAQRTFANSLAMVERAATDLFQKESASDFLFYVSPDSAVRAASESCDQALTKFAIDLNANPAVYATAVALKGTVTTAQDRKLIDRYIESGRHAGAALDSATRAHTSALFQRLSDVQRAFNVALASDTSTIVVAQNEIAGLPPQFVATLKKTPDGSYVVPVSEATAALVMRNASVPAVRKRYLVVSDRIGGEENVKRLSEALVLRDSLAHLFGVKNWAAYQLETKTARTPERVLAFLNDIDAQLLPKARAERDERAALKKAMGDTSAYSPWDYSYYSAQLRKQKYAVDEQEIRKYFPVDRVVSGVLEIYSRLLGVHFDEITPADAWAPDVREYALTDSATKQPLGWVFLDLFPRANKYNHFANWGLRARIARPDGTTDKAVGAIVGNWPTPEPGKPALLSHGDVITFFHEFGHLMAGTFATSPYGTNLGLRQDFVEAPSQMLENWMWQPEVLAIVSRNVETGKPLPKDLIDKMIAAKHVGDGLNGTQQVFFGMYDMLLASSPPSIDPTSTWDSLTTKLTASETIPGGFGEASFGHLMGGYDAGYYGYLWSRVYAQDLFTRFEKEGVMNPKTGLAYRKMILEPGALREPDELLSEFLGRPLDYSAFYRDMGIKK